MSKADLQKKLATLNAMAFDQLQRPKNMPVAVYLREAEEMLAAGRTDLAELERVGFQAEWLDDLSTRIGALRKAESEMLAELYSRGEAAKRWDGAATQGGSLLKELKETFIFAYRDDRAMLSAVREAVQGRSAGAMVQGLSNLALLGKDKTAPLEAINFDLARLDEAATLADRLGVLLGAYDAEREGQYDCARLRDAAFTHLKEGLKRLREYGLYVFQDDAGKKSRYTSAYLRKKRLERKRKRLERAGEMVCTGQQAGREVSQKVVEPITAFSHKKRGKKSGARPGEKGMAAPGERAGAVEMRTDSTGLRRRPLRRGYEGSKSAYGQPRRLYEGAESTYEPPQI